MSITPKRGQHMLLAAASKPFLGSENILEHAKGTLIPPLRHSQFQK